MTTREIAGHIGALSTEISADLASAVTYSVLEEVADWQGQGLDGTYAIVFFNAIRVKIRNERFSSDVIRLKAPCAARAPRPPRQFSVETGCLTPLNQKTDTNLTTPFFCRSKVGST